MGDLNSTLRDLTLLANLPDDAIAELAGKLERQSLGPNEILFREGDLSDALFIIDKGEVNIYLEDEDGQAQILNQLGAGQSLGEMSIIDGEPRTASVVTLSTVELLKLNRTDFLEVLSRQPPEVMASLRELADQMRLGFLDILKRLPLLEDLPDDAIDELAGKLVPVSLQENEILFRKGDPGNSLYIIDAGWVKIVTEDEQGEELILNQVGPGQAIGEMSLIDQEPRSASVVALSPTVQMFKLGGEDFLDVLAAQPEVALSVMRNLSGRMRFATTYIEQAIEWSRRIADGDYDFAMHEIESEQDAIARGQLSDEARATELLGAFFAMVKGVQEREQALKTQLQRLTIEIDEAKAEEDFERLTSSDFFADLKATAQKMRQDAVEE